MSSMKGRAVSRGGHGPRVVCAPSRRGAGVGGGVPVIHSAALGGPECLAVLGGSIKWAAVVAVLAGGGH